MLLWQRPTNAQGVRAALFSVSDGNLSDGYFELCFNYDGKQLNQLTSVMFVL